MATVTYQDVATSLGRTLSATEQAQVTQWIGDAELLISARLGDLTKLNQDRLKYVVREAVVQHALNPEGFQSETIDDYTYRRGTAAGRVAILDEWWELLNPTGESGAFTINPYPARRCSSGPWD
jgi:hypothetical protein